MTSGVTSMAEIESLRFELRAKENEVQIADDEITRLRAENEYLSRMKRERETQIQNLKEETKEMESLRADNERLRIALCDLLDGQDAENARAALAADDK